MRLMSALSSQGRSQAYILPLFFFCVEARTTSWGWMMTERLRGRFFASRIDSTKRAVRSPIYSVCWSMLESGTRSSQS